MILVLAKQELIGHPGNVVANHKVSRNLLRRVFLRFGHRSAPLQIIGKQLGQAGNGTRGILGARTGSL
jgi:hypothetical protein